MPSYITEYCAKFGDSVVQETFDSLKEACNDADVLYVTRIQAERFQSPDEYESLKVS
jgi:aspartate carbamoyltransferase catalytic subunit